MQRMMDLRVAIITLGRVLRSSYSCVNRETHLVKSAQCLSIVVATVGSGLLCTCG